MLQNAYFLAKIGADTAGNEQHFAEILPKIGNYPTGPRTMTDVEGVGLRDRLRVHPVDRQEVRQVAGELFEP